MDASFCVEALEEAFAHHGVPEIINTDQGSQFTAMEWIEAVKTAGSRVSMDSKGRWMDNVFIERLWRSLKYECVYLHAFETSSEARSGIGHWINFYNTQRPHSMDGHRAKHTMACPCRPRTRLRRKLELRFHLRQPDRLSKIWGPPLPVVTDWSNPILYDSVLRRRPLSCIPVAFQLHQLHLSNI